MASVLPSSRTDGQSYEDIIAKLNQSGVKTTNIRKGQEADFEDYGNALSPEVKHQIMDSFDNERDYAIQNKLAGFFSGRNVLTHSEFSNACKQAGFTVTPTAIKTNYIADYKGGNFSNDIKENSYISGFTISDGMGGEILIVDANGNGSIESEELFMNQLLGDLNLELSQVQPEHLKSAIASGTSPQAVKAAAEEEAKVSQEDFNKKVEEYLRGNSNLTIKDAERRAKINLNETSYSYTGSKTDEADENEINENQTKFNNKVEEYLKDKKDISYAQEKANSYLGLSGLEYTGNETTAKASQDEYNSKVDEFMANNANLDNAQTKAKQELNIFNLNYTGTKQAQEKELKEKELIIV